MSTATTAIKAKQRPGDRVFSGSAVFAGSMILVTLAAVAVFLIVQSLPALIASHEDASILTDNFWNYVGPLLFGTVWAAALALLMAIPISIGIALFISHYAPRRLASVLGYIVDLLAAVPSVVFGLWGIGVLAPAVQPVYSWLVENFGWFPLFAGPVSGTGRTILTAAIVLAVMVLPIMTAICREVFLQTPVLHEEAALALGATRWEMVRGVVLSSSRPGIAAALILGLGRALGEAIAVTQVIGNSLQPLGIDLFASGNTLASQLAGSYQSAPTNIEVASLVYLAVILLAITLVTNVLAQRVVRRFDRQLKGGT
jgi:phosphate transport system permease protein